MKKNHGYVPNHLSSWRPIKTPMKIAITKEIPTLEPSPRVLRKSFMLSFIGNLKPVHGSYP